MNTSMWLGLGLNLLTVALSQNPKTAKIANEVAAGAVEAEQIFDTKGSGVEKLAHVVRVAKVAAQAVDELRGGEDEAAGMASEIVSAAIPLINQLAKHATAASITPAH